MMKIKKINKEVEVEVGKKICKKKNWLFNNNLNNCKTI